MVGHPWRCGHRALDPTYEEWLAEFGSGQDPVTSVDDIDPNECNWVHNINACEGEEPPVVGRG